MNTLYHYVHCPFCVRVRMAAGLLNKPFNSIVLPYDDEKTPVDLMGVKMLPIMKFESGESMNESLDIIAKLDSNNILSMQKLDEKDERDLVEDLLSKIGSKVHSLVMPYWMWTNEFDETSRAYFQKKKEAKRGPFHELVKTHPTLLKDLEDILDILENSLTPFYKSEDITIFDIMIASHLWGMYVYPEFQFSSTVHSYLQSVKEKCSFNYHEDFWASANALKRK